MDLAARLIREHKVAVIPGDTFGLDGCHLRIAYGALSTSSAQEGIARLVDGLNQLLR
jgi:aspartate/methionine/tyrosine aminotransferase